jgi:hypothetical protein
LNYYSAFVGVVTNKMDVSAFVGVVTNKMDVTGYLCFLIPAVESLLNIVVSLTCTAGTLFNPGTEQVKN